jgi:hypothetical protein
MVTAAPCPFGAARFAQWQEELLPLVHGRQFHKHPAEVCRLHAICAASIAISLLDNPNDPIR